MESIGLAISQTMLRSFQHQKMKVLKEFIFAICVDWYWFDVHGEVMLSPTSFRTDMHLALTIFDVSRILAGHANLNLPHCPSFAIPYGPTANAGPSRFNPLNRPSVVEAQTFPGVMQLLPGTKHPAGEQVFLPWPFQAILCPSSVASISRFLFSHN